MRICIAKLPAPMKSKNAERAPRSDITLSLDEALSRSKPLARLAELLRASTVSASLRCGARLGGAIRGVLAAPPPGPGAPCAAGAARRARLDPARGQCRR